MLTGLFIKESLAATVKLLSGKEVYGEILERTEGYVRIDYQGLPLTYYSDEIEEIFDFNFETVVNCLNDNDFVKAEAILSQRVAYLKKVFKKNKEVIDSQPKFTDLLFLRHFINVYLGNLDAAESDAIYLDETLSFPEGKVLRDRLQKSFVEKSDHPGEFIVMLKKMAEMIWLTRDS